MFKKILAATLAMLAAVAMLFSCGGNDPTGNNGGGGGNDNKVIYSPSTELNIISAAGEIDAKLTSDLASAISKLSGKMPRVLTDASETGAHEIVIGNTKRSISQTAYSLIEEPDDFNTGRYVIYSTEESLAIAFYSDVALEKALAYLTENYLLTDTLTIKSGIVKTEDVDLDAYYQAIDDAKVEAEWVALAEAVGGGEIGANLVKAMKDLYTAYDDSMIDWFANLYDPETGGYYYSNSGRDNQGYLPDIESTAQALKFITTSGMADTLGDGTYVSAIPEEMKEQIVKFIKGLQDPDGYFYHPQWTKNQHGASRLARDMGNAVSVLKSLGSAPTYNTPNGDKGDGLLYDGTPAPAAAKLTGKLGQSAVVAVSEVIATATAYMKELENKDTFLAYLDSLKITANSYSAGNTLTSIMSQIVQRDKTLKAEGADYSLVDILIDYLNERQNPENGTWSAETNYYAVNGLMKISGVYSKAGIMIPNYKAAIKSAIDAITSDEKIDSVTSIYNTWYTINRIRAITNSYGTAEEKAEVRTIINELLANAPEALAATKAKILVFKKGDGSFSYKPDSSAPNSQGCPVAIPGTNEGDVNATVICSSDILVYVYGALGVSDYSVSIYTYNDWRRYENILENLPPIVKNEEYTNDELYTFEDDEIGGNPALVTVSEGSGGDAIQVVEDGRGGKAVQISSINGVNDSVNVYAGSRVTSKSCFVFEADFRLDSSATAYPIQIFMGEAYMLTIRKEGGKVAIVESSSSSSSASKDNNLKLTPELGEWFNLRVEYYVGTAETVRIKVYYNKELAAVTDNYFDKSGAKLTGTSDPSTVYENAQIFVVKAGVCTLLVDNVRAYKTDDKYVAEPDKKLVINVDGPKQEEAGRADITNAIPEGLETYYKNSAAEGTRYDFTDATVTKYSQSNPNGFLVETPNSQTTGNLNNGKVKYDVESNDLYVSTKAWSGLSIAYQGETALKTGDKYIAEMNFTWLGGTPSSDTDPRPAFFGFLNTNSIDNKGMASWAYISFLVGDTETLDFCGASLKKNHTYNLRLEHTVGGKTELYLNGELAATFTSDTAGVNDANFLGLGFYFRSKMADPFEFVIDDVYLGVVSAS